MQDRIKLEQEFTQTLHVVNYDDMSVILKHIREAVLAGASVDEFVTVLVSAFLLYKDGECNTIQYKRNILNLNSSLSL